MRCRPAGLALFLLLITPFVPLTVWAQQAGKVARLGVLWGG